MDFEESATKKNIEKAFAGESQAESRYVCFSSIAKKEGYEQIADIFLETANNEKEHAKIWLKYLKKLGSTRENLEEAAKGENFETTKMYVEFEKKAREEGFEDIAEHFKKVGEIEREHEKRFRKLLENVEKDEVFGRKTGICMWKCRNCGCVHCGLEAPKVCPVCHHGQAYFEIEAINY